MTTGSRKRRSLHLCSWCGKNLAGRLKKQRQTNTMCLTLSKKNTAKRARADLRQKRHKTKSVVKSHYFTAQQSPGNMLNLLHTDSTKEKQLSMYCISSAAAETVPYEFRPCVPCLHIQEPANFQLTTFRVADSDLAGPVDCCSWLKLAGLTRGKEISRLSDVQNALTA